MARAAVLESTYEIDTNPTGVASYSDIGGLEDVGFAVAEEVRTGYFVGAPNGYSDVTAGRLDVTLTGKRIVDDTGQDYIVGLLGSYGTDRKSTLKITAPDGTIFEIPCSIEITSVLGGASADLDAFSCICHSDGDFTVTVPTI